MQIKTFKFCLVTVVLCYGQAFILSQSNGGLTRTYFLDHRSTIFHAVRPFGDQVIVLGQLGTDSLGNNGVFVASIDTMGEIKKLRIFQDPLGLNSLNLSYYSCEAIASTPDGGFVFSGSTRFSKNLFIIKVNAQMEMEYFKEYECDFLFRYVNYMITYQDAFYTVGIVQTENLDFEIFIQKSDLDGNQIWEKTYGIPQNMESAQSAVIEKGGITVLRTDSFDPNQFVYNDALIWNKLMHIDTSGKILWQWISQKNEEGATPEGLIKINYDYFYTTHPFYQVSGQLVHYAPEIVCRDSLFHLKWKRTYGDTLYLNWFSTLTTGPDSFLYAAGYIPDGVTWGRVCKIDPENGDLLWDARDTAFYIPGWGSRNRMEGLTVLPSGSVIAVGYTVDYTGHENGLLYKVTKEGCLDTLCTPVGIDELIEHPDDRIRVYPNPATLEINFESMDYSDERIVELYRLDGSLVSRNTLSPGVNKLIIDKAQVSPGLYLWRLLTRANQTLDTGKIFILQ